MKYILFVILFATTAQAKDLVNLTYATTRIFPGNNYDPKYFDTQFRVNESSADQRYEISFNYCSEYCYQLGFGQSFKENQISKYSDNSINYISYYSKFKYSYLNIKLLKKISESSDAGLYINMGIEDLNLYPKTNLATQEIKETYSRTEIGGIMRLGTAFFQNIFIEKAYIVGGVNISIKNNSNITINNEVINSSELEKQRIQFLIGFGIIF